MDKVRQKGFLGEKVTFSCCLTVERKKGEKSENFKLLSSICGVLSVGIRRAKSEIHLLDEGYVWVQKKKKRDFTEDQKEEILGNQFFWEINFFGIMRCS